MAPISVEDHETLYANFYESSKQFKGEIQFVYVKMRFIAVVVDQKFIIKSLYIFLFH